MVMPVQWPDRALLHDAEVSAQAQSAWEAYLAARHAEYAGASALAQGADESHLREVAKAGSTRPENAT